LQKNRPSGLVLEPNYAESSSESSSEDGDVDCRIVSINCVVDLWIKL